MPGDIYEYVCKECGLTIEAETWDAAELPRLWCPECDTVMDIGAGKRPSRARSSTEGDDAES